jgi:hypothetical protein
LKDLPVVVLSNNSDLSFLKKTVTSSSNYKKSCSEVSLTLLEKYNTSEPVKQGEFISKATNLILLGLLIISIFLNLYFFFFE